MSDDIRNDLIREKVQGTLRGQPFAQYEPDGCGPISINDAMEGINKIRNSIVGLQTVNWSEHIYPLVALLNRAGYVGLDYPQNLANHKTLLSNYKEAIELLKASPSLNGHSEWRLQVETFFKRSGSDD